MPDYPTTPEEAKTWRYGRSVGEEEYRYNPKGSPYNPNKCAFVVVSDGFRIYYQCTHKPGHGPHGMFCRKHARIIEASKGENNA